MLKAIIIGQGLAGSILAWELHQRRHQVLIVDNGHRTSASIVAAGMVNPVQGQRLNLAWRAEECLPRSQAFFDTMAKKFGRTFFHETSILRLINNEQENEFLAKRREDDRFAPYLGHNHAPSASREISDGHGGLFINQSGYVEIRPLLESLRDYFRVEGILCDTEFDHADVSITTEKVSWREFEAEQIIFAEGWRVLENPWFREFNFQPNKGEILTLGADREFPEHPINRGKWIIPRNNGTVWVGSTYGRGQTDASATDAARDEIMEKVAAI
ncbi:MAG: NAD(P)/FAD-dependent oxidoreductase, partial [Puniceicoccales bacterium]